MDRIHFQIVGLLRIVQLTLKSPAALNCMTSVYFRIVRIIDPISAMISAHCHRWQEENIPNQRWRSNIVNNVQIMKNVEARVITCLNPLLYDSPYYSWSRLFQNISFIYAFFFNK